MPTPAPRSAYHRWRDVPGTGVTSARWRRSILDWGTHLVDPLGEHPICRYRAACGHTLLAVTECDRAAA